MARKRASMREGPLAELFKATEAAQRQSEQGSGAPEGGVEPQVPEEPVGESPPQRHLEPVTDVPAPPVPTETRVREKLRPELWEVAPEPPLLHSVPRPDSGTYVAVIK